MYHMNIDIRFKNVRRANIPNIKLMISSTTTNMFDKILHINVMIVVSFEFQVFTP